MGDDSIPDIEIDAEVTEATGSSGHSRSTTRPHATVEWLGGFDEGRRRGAADVLDALAAALSSVGVPEDVASAIVEKVRARAGVTGG
jgi:hypothetical protein